MEQCRRPPLREGSDRRPEPGPLDEGPDTAVPQLRAGPRALPACGRPGGGGGGEEAVRAGQRTRIASKSERFRADFGAGGA